jgi:hypothetical protein
MGSGISIGLNPLASGQEYVISITASVTASFAAGSGAYFAPCIQNQADLTSITLLGQGSMYATSVAGTAIVTTTTAGVSYSAASGNFNFGVCMNPACITAGSGGFSSDSYPTGAQIGPSSQPTVSETVMITTQSG